MGCDDEERLFGCIDPGVMEMCDPFRTCLPVVGMGNSNCFKGKGPRTPLTPLMVSLFEGSLFTA